MNRQTILKTICITFVIVLLIGTFLTGCTSEVERIHTQYVKLRAEPNPTMDTVQEIARLRLRLIALVGEEEQRRLIEKWNNE